MSIRGKMALVLAAISLLPYTSLMVYVWLSSHIQYERAAASAYAQAQAITHAIELDLRHATGLVESWVLRGGPIDEFAVHAAKQTREDLEGIWRRDGASTNSLAHYLRQLQHASRGRFAEIFVTDDRGFVVAATGQTTDFGQGPDDDPPDGEPWWWDARSLGMRIGRLNVDESAGVHSIDISMALGDPDEFHGVLKAVYNVEEALEAVEQSRVGVTGHAVIVDGKGKVIAAPRRFAHLAGEQHIDLAGLLSIMDSTDGGVVITEVPWAGRVLLATAPTDIYPSVQWVDWRVVVVVPADEALLSWSKLSAWGVLTLIAVALAVFMTSVLASRSLSRPLVQIADAVAQIDGGKLDVQVPHEGHDEVGTVASAINTMTARLRHFESINVEKIQHLNRELSDANRKLHELATRDELTGLANVRRFREHLHEEIARARRAGLALALVIIDLDHFKRVNDTYGHLAGDAVLRAVGGLLRRIVRATDLAARYGGEELAVILHNSDAEAATIVAEKIRAEIEALEVHHDGKALTVTASLGVTELAEEMGSDAEVLVSAADRALYEAKTEGRNRVRVRTRH